MTTYHLLYKRVPFLNKEGRIEGIRKENQFITPSRKVAIDWAEKDDLHGFETYLDPAVVEQYMVHHYETPKPEPVLKWDENERANSEWGMFSVLKIFYNERPSYYLALDDKGKRTIMVRDVTQEDARKFAEMFVTRERREK